jgi:hypothetical protein
MKSHFKVLAVLAVLGIGVAYAANIAVDYGQRWVQGGFGVGPSSAAYTPVKRIGTANCSYDFPSLPAGYSARATDKTCTGTNIKLGDPCFVGVAKTSPDDAGSGWQYGLHFTGVAIADNTIMLQEENVAGDGGAFNLPDAGFNVTCIGNL